MGQGGEQTPRPPYHPHKSRRAYRGEEHGVGIDGGLHQEAAVHREGDGSQEHEVAEGEQERGHPLLGCALGSAVVRAAPPTPACGPMRCQKS